MSNERRIRIHAGAVSVDAELNPSPTAALVWNALPIEAAVEVWGDEIFFAIPVETSEAADARALVEVGTIAYWPPGRAFCIFFGPTPSSRTTEEIRAYSPVNIVGKVSGGATTFRQVRAGTTIRIEHVTP